MWNPETLRAYTAAVADVIGRDDVQAMAAQPQHVPGVSCLDHSLFVSYVAFVLCRALHLNAAAAARAGLLHDMHLSAPPHSRREWWRHLRRHPEEAVRNAQACGISALEADIIAKHMWPLSLTRVPRYRESFVVNLVDTLCAGCELTHVYALLGVDKWLGRFNRSRAVLAGETGL